MTAFIKTKLKITDEQIIIAKYRVATHAQNGQNDFLLMNIEVLCFLIGI